MAVEIAAGVYFGSMALLADGVHMATHVGALGLAAGAYWLGGGHAENARANFWPGQFGDLRGLAHDHILRGAYLHVLADAATSVLATAALSAGPLLGLRWLDPAVGVAGAFVIASWAFGLARDSGMVLLDAEADPALARDIRAAA